MAPKIVPLREPVEKLPLTTRKNLRDEWEAKRPEYEENMSEIMGVPWTIDLNPNLIYAYADESYKPRLGSVINWYIEAFVPNLKQFVEKFGKDGREELNTMCPKHQLVVAPQEATTFSYGGLEIKDGLLRLVFQEKNLGVNTNDVSKQFAEALKDAPPPSGASAFNLVARNGVREYYDPEIENVREAIAEIVGMENLKLNPNFEQNAAELAKPNGPEGWDRQIGRATLEYFQSIQSALERQGFKGDEMLQEGFQEGVSKGEISFRVVEKLQKGSYNEVIIEDGILYAQTTPKQWYVNVYDVAAKLIDLL